MSAQRWGRSAASSRGRPIGTKESGASDVPLWKLYRQARGLMAGVRQPVCKFELDNLVNIKVEDPQDTPEEKRNKLVLKEALGEWKEQVQALEAKLEKRTHRTNLLTNELYQLVGLYSVFVGVVFTAGLQSTRVECHHIWSPIVLCLVAYFATWFIINKKSKEIEIDRLTIKEDDKFRKIRVENIRALKSKGHSVFDFGHCNVEPAADENKGAKKSKKGRKRDPEASSRPHWLIGILTFFTAVLLFSFVHILCINTTSSCSCPNSVASAPIP